MPQWQQSQQHNTQTKPQNCLHISGSLSGQDAIYKIRMLKCSISQCWNWNLFKYMYYIVMKTELLSWRKLKPVHVMATTVGTCIANNCTIQIPCCNASVGTCIQLVTDDYIMHLSIVFPSPRTWWGRFPSFCGKKCPWGRGTCLTPVLYEEVKIYRTLPHGVQFFTF